MENEKRIIYRLECPFTKEVHYVGKSTKGMIRPVSHLTKSHSEKINYWVSDLSVLGHSPKVEICEYVPNEVDINEREKYWISKYIDEGNTLLNVLSNHPLSISENLESKINDGSDFISQLSSFVKTRRKKLDCTQEELSKRSGLGIRFIRDLEQCKDKSFSTSHIIQLLSMFGCTLDIKKDN